MKRTIIKIDEELCNGCGNCITGCHEGALQLINGKAVLTNEVYCDGLGACIGECSTGAITLEEREAEPYDEAATLQRMNVCPGSKMREIHRDRPATLLTTDQPSELRQFPVQLHLLHPGAGFLHRAHLLLAADCTAFACGNFHSRFLKGKALAIACPKLDSHIEAYIDKLAQMITHAQLETLTVMMMEVPCCGGLLRIAQEARARSKQIPLKVVIINIEGEVMSEEWV